MTSQVMQLKNRGPLPRRAPKLSSSNGPSLAAGARRAASGRRQYAVRVQASAKVRARHAWCCAHGLLGLRPGGDPWGPRGAPYSFAAMDTFHTSSAPVGTNAQKRRPVAVLGWFQGGIYAPAMHRNGVPHPAHCRCPGVAARAGQVRGRPMLLGHTVRQCCAWELTQMPPQLCGQDSAGQQGAQLRQQPTRRRCTAPCTAPLYGTVWFSARHLRSCLA